MQSFTSSPVAAPKVPTRRNHRAGRFSATASVGGLHPTQIWLALLKKLRRTNASAPWYALPPRLRFKDALKAMVWMAAMILAVMRTNLTP
jgi:hypothetical protein